MEGETPKQNPEQTAAFIRAEKIRWENRRKMAWVALFAIIFQTLALLFAPAKILTPEKIKVIQEPLTWAYMCESAIILAYMGFTTWAYLKEKISIAQKE
jgi:hypothetical protein